MAGVGGSSPGTVRSPGLARPHSTWVVSACPLRATYRVRPASRTWLGVGSPNAAATNDGAAMAELDSTAQSGKNARIRSPSPVLKMRITMRRSGLRSWARSAAWKLARSSRPIRAMARAECTWAAANAALSRSSCSMTRTPGSWAIRGPWPRLTEPSSTVTRSP